MPDRTAPAPHSEMRHRAPARAAFLFALVALAVGLPVGSASAAAEPGCGDVITEDTVLTEDIVCAWGEGIRSPGPHGSWNPLEYALLIGADGVTLDLNGHQVYVLELDHRVSGIGVFGHSDVVIKDGSPWQVTMFETTDSLLTGLTGARLDLMRSHGNRVTHSSAGIGLSASDDNLVEHNYAASEGGGVTLRDGSDRNIVRSNKICGGMYEPLIVEDSSYNLIERNVLPGCPGWSGIYVTVGGASVGNRLIDNAVTGDRSILQDESTQPDGILVTSPDTYLAGNVATNHHGYGINAVEGVESGVNYAAGNGNPAQCRNVLCVPPGSASPAGPRPSTPAGPPAASAPAELPAPAAPAGPPPVKPAARVAAKRRQRLGRAIRVTVFAAEDIRVIAAGKLTRGAGRSRRLTATASRFIAGGERLTLRLPVPAGAWRALRRGTRITATIRVRVTTPGEVSTHTRSVSLL